MFDGMMNIFLGMVGAVADCSCYMITVDPMDYFYGKWIHWMGPLYR